MGGHERAIYSQMGKLYLVGEQFWGRAVRASRNSKEFGALLIFATVFHHCHLSLYFCNALVF
jgi:hypothetical protein